VVAHHVGRSFRWQCRCTRAGCTRVASANKRNGMNSVS